MSRFLYIDSKGKEVPIPSVDALALRIELGAVKEDTQFFDSAANRWARAGEHEVFRSLQREAEEKSTGRVAPPPAPLPPPPIRAASPPPLAPVAEDPPAPAESYDVFSGIGGMDLGLTLDDGAMAAAEAPAEEVPKPAKNKKEDAFDFTGFGGGLTEDEDDDYEQDARPAAAAPPEPGGGLALEDTLAASYDLSGAGQAIVSGEKIETDAPLSEQSTQGSQWAQRLETVDENEEAVAAASATAAAALPPSHAAGGSASGSGNGERAPRARPAAAPQKESAGIPMALIAAVVLLLLGGGGFLGWTMMQGGGESAVVEEIDPPVTIPDLPAELEPRMREVAQLALADWVVAVRDSLPVQQGIAAEPDPAWLGSEYMAEASGFGGVAEYWRELDAYVTGILADEQRIYESFLDARLVDTLGAPDSDAQLLKERAAAGFQAARPDRRVAYRELRSVIDAAAGLHEFLVENEDEIQYRPGPERDPVLEAVPATRELGDDMWGMVDDITAALDRLGAIDKVTTQRLLDLAVVKFEEVGIR